MTPSPVSKNSYLGKNAPGLYVLLTSEKCWFWAKLFFQFIPFMWVFSKCNLMVPTIPPTEIDDISVDDILTCWQ